MFFLRFFLISSLAISVFSQESWAAEKEEEVSVNYSGSQNQDWEKVQARVAALKAKVDAQDALVQSLAAEKNHLQGQALISKVEQLKKEHETLRSLTAEYNKLNDEYLTKYPERGLKEKRVYPRLEAKPLDAYENNRGSVGGQVKRVHKKILEQYSRSKKDSKKGTQKVQNRSEEALTSAPAVPETTPESKRPQPASSADEVTAPILYKQ